MKMLGVTALLGLFLSSGMFLIGRKANACAIPVYTEPGVCVCAYRDWGYAICAEFGDGPCFTANGCGGGPPIILA